MTFDPRTEANIATLTPATQAKARAFIQAVLDSKGLPNGWKIEIIAGRRTYAEQDALYAQGRSKPGRIVTNAPAGWSNHNFGTAFDIGLFNEASQYIDALPDTDHAWSQTRVSAFYASIAPLGEALGLAWGGNWRIDDEPHYEMDFWPGMSEDQRVAKLRLMRANGETIA